MAQYYQINLEDLKHLNLDNCVFMSEDGTLNPQSVVLADQTTQVVDTNQMPQIIYQQNAQPAQIHADGQIHYVVQEEDLQNDSYSLVSQPGTPQVYYSKIETENGTQLIPHTAASQSDLTNIIEVNSSQVQYQQNQNVQQIQPQYQQIVIQNYQQGPQQVLVYPQIQQSSNQQQLVQVQSPVQTQVQQSQSHQQQSHHQAPTHTIQIQSSPSQIQTTSHGNRIQIQTPTQTQIRKVFPQDVGIQKRFIHQPAGTQIQMPAPQKIMQPTGMNPSIRFPSPMRHQINQTRVITPQRAPRPRAQSVRTRTPVNVTIPVQMAATNTTLTNRQRLTLTRLSSPSSQPQIIFTGQKQLVSIANSPKTVNMVRPELAIPNKQVNNTATTSNTGTNISGDLEDSITAATISKPATVQPINTSQIVHGQNQIIHMSTANDNNRVVTYQMTPRQAQASVQHLSGIKPISRAAAVKKASPRFTAPIRAQIRPTHIVQQPKPIIQQLQQPQSQIETVAQMPQQIPQQKIEREVQDSARMLIVLENGEQRLITFTLPKESCTIRELLEQIGVPFEADTNIQCKKNPGLDIDYLVTVGVNISDTPTEIIKAAENSLQLRQIKQQSGMLQEQLQQQQHQQPQIYQTQTHIVTTNSQSDGESLKQQIIVQQQQQQQQQQPLQQKTPTHIIKTNAQQVQKSVSPIFICGFLAVCTACGYSGSNHAQCQRCLRIFTEEPKRTPVAATKPKTTAQKTVVSHEKQKKVSIDQAQKRIQLNERAPMRGGRAPLRPNVTLTRKSKKTEEPVVLTLSSDEEYDADTSTSKKADSNDNKWLPFEPDLVDNEEPANFNRENVTDLSTSSEKLSTKFRAKTIYLGTYAFEPTEDIFVTSKGIRIYAPSVKHPDEKTVLDIQKSEIVKIVSHFSRKSLISLYVLNTCSRYVRENLEMTKDSKLGFFSSVSSNAGEKRIVIETETLTDVSKSVIKSIFTSSIMEEISYSDMSIMQNQVKSAVSVATNGADSKTDGGDNNNLLIYPPTGRNRYQIGDEDYICLGIDQYLNDIIIDFYLTYLGHEVLTPEQRQKTHFFSTFFYNTLTNTKLLGSSNDVKLTAAQKRHERVKNWTKNVNIFEKDFIVVPINQQSHWFLAIICYPSLKGPVTMDNNQPIKNISNVKKKPTESKKKTQMALQIGNTTIIPVTKKEPEALMLDDESERDEAEGDDSDLDSNDSESEATEPTSTTQSIKQPCILVFDSLAGASRSRVVATLRDYLTCEYKAKIKVPADHVFDRFNIVGHSVKVPQQTNFTDCGLYVLQYVEQFFKDPIKNYRIPIKELTKWFDTITVTKKREDIALLIRDLILKEGRHVKLPEIQLPTNNGEMVDLPDFLEEHGDFEDEESGLEHPEEQQPEATPPQVAEPVQEIQKIPPTQLTQSAQKKRTILNRKNANQNSDNSEVTPKRRRN